MPTDPRPAGADLEAVAGEARRLRRLGWAPAAIAGELGISRRAVLRATGEAEAYRPGAVRVARYSG